MQDKIENIVISLAGMLQATTLILELSQKGKIDDQAFETCIYSIFQTDPTDVASVYGGLDHIKLGLEKVITTFDPLFKAGRLQNRYLLSLIHLQKKLARSPHLLQILKQRLKQTQKQVDYFSLTHPTVISNLADIYSSTINTFRFRVVILGSSRILHAKENTEKIRALLLAGIRSATLWRQSGGSRLQMLFMRTNIKNTAETLLAKKDFCT